MKYFNTIFSIRRKIKVFFYSYLLKQKLQKRVFFLIIAIFIWNSFEIINTDKKEFWKSKSDFEDYYIASIRLKNFQDPYFSQTIEDFLNRKDQIQTLDDLKNLFERTKGIGTYLYLPFFSFILIPLTFFDYKIAALLYQFFQIGFIIISFYIFFLILKKLYPKLSKRKLRASILMGFIFLLPILIQNLSNGNVGFLIIFFLSVSLFLFFYNQKQNVHLDFWNGFLIGIATIIKIIPGFIMGFYFLKRKYMILFGFLIGILAGLFLPSLYLGWETNSKFLNNWYELIILNLQKYASVRPYANNQTISSAFFKLFVPYSDLKQFLYGLPLPFFLEDPNQIKVWIQILNFILLSNLALITLLFTFRKSHSQIFFLYYLYLVFLTSLLTSGISWYHSYGILLLVFIFYYVSKPNLHSYLFVLPALFLWLWLFFPYKIRDFISLYSFYVWLNLGILIFISIFLYKEFLKIKKGYET